MYSAYLSPDNETHYHIPSLRLDSLYSREMESILQRRESMKLVWIWKARHGYSRATDRNDKKTVSRTVDDSVLITAIFRLIVFS